MEAPSYTEVILTPLTSTPARGSEIRGLTTVFMNADDASALFLIQSDAEVPTMYWETVKKASWSSKRDTPDVGEGGGDGEKKCMGKDMSR